MYRTKFRAVCRLTLFAVLLAVVPPGAFAQDEPDCDYCYDLECNVDWIEVFTRVAIAVTICTASQSLTPVAGGMVCGTTIAMVSVSNRERLEDCSNQDECYDDCSEEVC